MIDYDNAGISFSVTTTTNALIAPNRIYNLSETKVITLLVLVILAALLSFGYLCYQFFPRKAKKNQQTEPLIQKV